MDSKTRDGLMQEISCVGNMLDSIYEEIKKSGVPPKFNDRVWTHIDRAIFHTGLLQDDFEMIEKESED